MSNDEEKKDDLIPAQLIKFAAGGCSGMVAVLVFQTMVAFLAVVIPGILGPILLSAGFVTVILGWRLITNVRGYRDPVFLYIAGTLALMGGLLGMLSHQAVDAPPLQALLVAPVAAAIAVLGTWAVGNLANRLNNGWRISLGVALIVLGVIVPAVIEGFFLVDLL